MGRIQPRSLWVAVGLGLAGALACSDAGRDPEATRNTGAVAAAGPEHRHEESHGLENGGPQDLASAWTALSSARDAIAAAIDAGHLDRIHDLVGPVPALAERVAAHSTDLAASRRARVEAAASEIRKMADALHTAADAGDAPKTQQALSRLDAMQRLMRTQYADGVLPAS